MKTQEQDTVNYVHQSQKYYFVCYGNSFIVLPDGKTIIGEDYDNVNMLISEDITMNDYDALAEIHKHGDTIYTVFYDEVSKSLFVGGVYELNQYKKYEESKYWFMVRDYGDIGIGDIYSIKQIGNLLVFGGNYKTLIAMDSVKQQILEGEIETAIENIYSLQVCELEYEKTYLSVNGSDPNYSYDVSDLYDVTDMVKTFGYTFGTVLENKHNKKNTLMNDGYQDHLNYEPTDEKNLKSKKCDKS
jgi:hypothetical protein